MTTKERIYMWLIMVGVAHALIYGADMAGDWRNDYRARHSDAWQATAERQKSVIEKYEAAAQQCSYVVGQHIQILSGLRVMQRDAYVCGNKIPPVPERYNFFVENLERETPKLSAGIKEAREAAQKAKLPLFIGD